MFVWHKKIFSNDKIALNFYKTPNWKKVWKVSKNCSEKSFQDVSYYDCQKAPESKIVGKT